MYHIPGAMYYIPGAMYHIPGAIVFMESIYSISLALSQSLCLRAVPAGNGCICTSGL